MHKITTAYSLNYDNLQVSFDIELPNACPRCSIAYGDEPLISYYVDADITDTSKEGTQLFSMFFCPHCEQCFMVEYFAQDSFDDVVNTTIIQVYPPRESIHGFSKKINNISTNFVEIYQQAEKAENIGLDQICGIGYRKALEFLIKDYAIHLYPNKQNEIESSFLSKCIAEYITNDKIKTLATASTWIGNDETHYIRKNQNYNTNDLKRFINAVVAYIECELNYEEAFNILSNPS